MARLINVSAVKAFARSVNPDLRLSSEFLDTFDAKARGDLIAYIKINGSKRTMKGDVFLGLPSRGKR